MVESVSSGFKIGLSLLDGWMLFSVSGAGRMSK